MCVTRESFCCDECSTALSTARVIYPTRIRSFSEETTGKPWYLEGVGVEYPTVRWVGTAGVLRRWGGVRSRQQLLLERADRVAVQRDDAELMVRHHVGGRLREVVIRLVVEVWVRVQ